MCAYTQPASQLCASDSEHKPSRPFWREPSTAESWSSLRFASPLPTSVLSAGGKKEWSWAKELGHDSRLEFFRFVLSFIFVLHLRRLQYFQNWSYLHSSITLQKCKRLRLQICKSTVSIDSGSKSEQMCMILGFFFMISWLVHISVVQKFIHPTGGCKILLQKCKNLLQIL